MLRTSLRGAVVLVALFIAGCSPVPIEPPATAALGRDLTQPEVPGLPFDDPRLGAVLAELRRHPEWLDEPLPASPTVLALVPGTTELCLALEGSAGDVLVTIDPSDPWGVDSVAIERGLEFEGGREFTFGADHPSSDVCAHLFFGRLDPFPVAADAIEVTGNADAPLARAVAQAVHERPERFGIDRQGVPAVVVGDLSRPAPAGWRCLTAVVYVGGPRAQVVIGSRPTSDGRLEIDSRIVKRALLVPEPQPAGRC